MNWRNDLSLRALAVPGAVVLAAVAFLLYAATFSDNVRVTESAPAPGTFSAPAATFAGTNLGGIVDGGSTCAPSPGAPREVSFQAAGLSGPPTAVDISMAFGGPAHTWVGDITAVLIAPNGASHSIFGRTGATTATSAGDSSDIGTTYTFSDSAAAPPSGGWWQAATVATAAVVMPTGTYRTTNSGGAGATNPMPATNMNTAFGGVANPNGTWTLRLTDGCSGDTGAISAATLTVAAGAGVPSDANVDMDGDGKTDFVVARVTTTPLAETNRNGLLPGRAGYASLEERPARGERLPEAAVPQAPPIYWYTSLNSSGATSVVQLGDGATDFVTPEDFDGDLKDDYAVWTQGASGSANFKVLQSTTNTVQVHVFGQGGDDPTVVGDYDGDNKADVAVYRCPPFGGAAGQCFFFYRGSNANPSGNITYVPWGFGVSGDFFPYVGNFDSDNKNDFCIQRVHPTSAGNGQFVLLRSSDSGIEYINWGLDTDFLIPGDYDGDGRTDFCVRRTVTGSRQHYLLTRTGATSQTAWGIPGDSSAPGDYDGDGKTDFAIWRPSADSSQNFFWILNSSTNSVTQFEWGQCPTGNCDFAVAGWAVH